VTRTGTAPRLSHRLQDIGARALIGGALLLPLRARLALFRALIGDVIGPLVGWRGRARDNLAKVWPDRPPAERAAIARASLRSAAQVLIENYDPDALRARAVRFPVSGPGLQALDAARSAGRPILFITGHYGNHEAIRAALHHRGMALGGMYRPMQNPAFNAHYVAAMERMGKPVFPSDKRGTAFFLRALQAGTPMLLLNDLHIWRGEIMDFLGQPALTALSAARMAVRAQALMLPIYAIRDAQDPTLYRIEVEAPVAHGDPRTMTEALNRSLEARIRADPGQWFWIHRRWKV
jgi:KDO2-lipid IV(A) lauroyltransferase